MSVVRIPDAVNGFVSEKQNTRTTVVTWCVPLTRETHITLFSKALRPKGGFIEKALAEASAIFMSITGKKYGTDSYVGKRYLAKPEFVSLFITTLNPFLKHEHTVPFETIIQFADYRIAILIEKDGVAIV